MVDKTVLKILAYLEGKLSSVCSTTGSPESIGIGLLFGDENFNKTALQLSAHSKTPLYKTVFKVRFSS